MLVFSGFRKPDVTLEVLCRDVQAGRLRAELSGRPGHHQPLQTATGNENDQEGRTGNAIFHKHCPRSHLNVAIETHPLLIKGIGPALQKVEMT